MTSQPKRPHAPQAVSPPPPQETAAPAPKEGAAAAAPAGTEAVAAGAEEPSPYRESFKEAWQATLGTLGNAEEETQALLGRLVALGHLSREEGARLYGDVRILVEQRRNELEQRVQSAIDAAMQRLTIPSQQDIAEVAQKVAELERRVEALGDLDPTGGPFQHPSSILERMGMGMGKKKPAARK